MISIPKLNGIKKMVVDDSACYNRDHDFTRTLADYVVGGSIEPGNSMDKILRTYTTVSSVENSVPGVTAKIEDNGRLIVFNGTNKSTKIEYMQYTMKNIFGEEKTFSHPIYPYALVEEGIVMRDNFYMRAGVDESSFLFKNYCSEPYEAEAIGLPEGLKLQPWAHSDSDWLIVNYGGVIRAGDYSFTLKLTSESNTVMKNVVIHLSEGERPTNTMVTGKITDLSGNLIDETIDTPELFMTEVGSDGFIDLKETGKYEEIDVDDKGEFSFQRCKVGKNILIARMNQTLHPFTIFELDVKQDEDNHFDLKLPYSVVQLSDAADYSSEEYTYYTDLYSEDNLHRQFKWEGNSFKFYLKPGTYNFSRILGKPMDLPPYLRCKLNYKFAVLEEPMQVIPVVSEMPEIPESFYMELNKATKLNTLMFSPNMSRLIKFIAPETGRYLFTTYGTIMPGGIYALLTLDENEECISREQLLASTGGQVGNCAVI